MPFTIMKTRKNKYSIVNKYTGRNFSPKGIPLSRAKKQLAALYINLKKDKYVRKTIKKTRKYPRK
jgi:hypothetical protein